MTDIISASEKADFFSAIKDVTDSFGKNTIVYHRVTTDYDQYSENNKPTEIDMNLKCRVTIEQDENAVQEEGTLDKTILKAMFNFADLKGASPTLTSGNEAIFKNEVDEFTYLGTRYRVKNINYLNSDFAGQNAVCQVIMKRKRKTIS